MSNPPLLIFGPTGNVGSATALRAQELNNNTILAMRDPSKALPSRLSGRNLQTVKADLTSPTSITSAVRHTGAKRAFVYVIFTAPVGMREALTALKDAGVEFVVFLSSIAIPDDPKKVEASNTLPYAHAQVEVSLAEVFGPRGYVAVRPGWFASNTLRWKAPLNEALASSSKEMEMVYPETPYDFISTDDIGRVCGSLLANPPPSIPVSVDALSTVVRLTGPQVIPQRQALSILLARAYNKDASALKVVAIDDKQAALNKMTRSLGMPEDLAAYLVEAMKKRGEGKDEAWSGSRYEEGVANIERYGGRVPTKFEDWVRSNKALFVD